MSGHSSEREELAYFKSSDMQATPLDLDDTATAIPNIYIMQSAFSNAMSGRAKNQTFH